MSSKLVIAAIALGGQAFAADSATASADPCASVYESCVQRGIASDPLGPNFAACGASSQACVNAHKSTMMPTVTSAPVASTTADPCESVFESCVQRGIASDPLGPNFAACGASSQACLATATMMPTMTSAPTASASADPCESVFVDCVQSGMTMLGGPNFAACGASSQACLATATMGMTASADKPAYTTEVVTAYTTYCPYATTISVNPSKTYTVTEPTTLTITDCPCTVSKPISTQPIVAHPTSFPESMGSEYPTQSIVAHPTSFPESVKSEYPTQSIVAHPTSFPPTKGAVSQTAGMLSATTPSVMAYTPTTSSVAQYTGAAVKTSLEIGSLFAAALAFIL